MSKETVAVAAFALSVIALVWNLGLTWVRWPRLSVQINQWANPGNTDPNAPRIKVVVVNHGAEAVAIRNIGIGVPQKHEFVRSRDYELDEVYHPEFVPEGPELPVKIDGRDVAVWTYSYKQLSQFEPGDEIVAYALRYRSFRLLPAWPPGRQKPKCLVTTEQKLHRLAVRKRSTPHRIHESRNHGTL